MPNCSVPDCVMPHHAKGLCREHYNRSHRGHAPVWTPPPAEARFWAKVSKTETCWLWTGYAFGGYGEFSVSGKLVRAPRFAYELTRGPIPEGLTIDHLCRNPLCVRPDHLEAVTYAVNNERSNSASAVNIRKTHCVHGHPFDEENTIWLKPSALGRAPRRGCRTCRRRLERLSRARRIRS